ncbi:MAG: leucyl/phenylalanyl-tRNA--protein transferase [Streptosporangiaceae bacterium]
MTPEPLPPSPWVFDPSAWPAEDCVAVGADLEPSTIVAAYRAGAFPMPLGTTVRGDGRVAAGPMAWWSPTERGVLRLDALRVSRSLRQSCGRYTTTVDRAFGDVIAACADPARPGAWISAEILEAYVRLYELGWAHSIETWDADGGLAGGLYGLAIGGLFAGESMFHHARDASKVALVGLVDVLSDNHANRRLIDVQWRTDHLATLGVTTWARSRYLQGLSTLVGVPLPALWR